MKKLLALILAAALALSLVACGGGGGADDNNTPSGGNEDTTSTDTPSGGEDEVNTLVIGNTATMGDWTFTLTDVEFANAVTDENSGSDYLRPANDEYKHTPGNAYYTAEDGKVFLFFTATLGYLGKETAEIGRQGKIHLEFEIHYGDGYTFNTYEFAIDSGNGIYYTYTGTFEPLSASRQCKGYFEVPIEIQNSTENPLELVVNIVDESAIFNLR